VVLEGIQGILPAKWKVEQVGLLGTSVLLTLEAPKDTQLDLLAALNVRLAMPRGTPPPLIFEGFSARGLPSFVAIQTELCPWEPEVLAP